mgnify:FL=1
MEKFTYLMCDGNLYKIGTSKHPKTRLKELRTANPYIELICFGKGVTEKYLHEMFFQKRKKGEWFDLSDTNLKKCKRLIVDGETSLEEHYKKRDDNYKKYYETGEYTSYTLSDKDIKNNISAKKQSVDLNKRYKINFGKYIGRKIITMTSDEEYDYCVWLLNSYASTLSGNQKKKDRKYKAFSWWVRLGYKQYIKNL